MIASSLASTNASLLGGAASPASSALGSSILGKDDFLKLLMAQMRNQNPMDPTNSTEFVSQLSQFSTLEGIQQLNTNFADMLALQQLTQGANLIGKTVVYDKTGSSIPGRGVVQAVKVQDGKLQLSVGNDVVTLAQVRGMMASPT